MYVKVAAAATKHWNAKSSRNAFISAFFSHFTDYALYLLEFSHRGDAFRKYIVFLTFTD
jgi:hypothetical protein